MTATTRPDFGPEQIRSSREVTLGEMIVPVHYKTTELDPFQVIGYFTNSIGRGFLVRNTFGSLERKFYADKGLIPYSKNRWNKNNWIKRPNKKEQL